MKYIISGLVAVMLAGCNVAYQCIDPVGTDNGIVICKDVKVLKGVN